MTRTDLPLGSDHGSSTALGGIFERGIDAAIEANSDVSSFVIQETPATALTK
jgi:hypothetical protein